MTEYGFEENTDYQRVTQNCPTLMHRISALDSTCEKLSTWNGYADMLKTEPTLQMPPKLERSIIYWSIFFEQPTRDLT